MNGILKTEFNLRRIFQSHDEAKLAVVSSIEALIFYRRLKPIKPRADYKKDGRIIA